MRALLAGTAAAALIAAIAPATHAALGCFGRSPTIVGTDHNDRLRGTDGVDVIHGRGGRDFIQGFDGGDFICGGAGRDTIRAGDGDDRLSGGGGSDHIAAKEGDDLVRGDGGADNISGDEGRDRVSGGDGDDAVFGGLDDDRVSGDAGADRLLSSFAREGDDGDDAVVGGPGRDTVVYEDVTRGITVNLGRSLADGWGQDRLAGIEDATGSRFDDTLIGDGDANRLQGYFGNDDMDGRGGIDEVLFFSRVIVNLAARSASGEGQDTIVRVENVQSGYGNDILIGDNGANRLHGAQGRDVIRGLAGDDELIGGYRPVTESGEPIGGERDTLFGGEGDDVLDGAWGSDNADFGTSSTPVEASLLTGSATGEGRDELLSVENLFGSGYDDALVGDDGPNTIDARSGNDSYDGRGNDDVLMGSNGSDAVAGGDGIDVLDLGRSTGPVTVDLGSGTGSGQGDDTFTGIENLFGSIYQDTLTGDAGDNLIDGRTAPDILDGGGGNDTMLGLKGDDDIVGGPGDDLFYDGDGDDTVRGDAGNDLMYPGLGVDSFDGGDGVDTLDFAFSLNGVSANLVTGTIETTGSTETDRVATVENLHGTPHTDEFIGDDADNLLVGGIQKDQLVGGAGDDTIAPGRGGDVVDGGEGIDTITFATAVRPVAIDLASGFSTGQGSKSILAVENIIGSPFGDVLRGDDTANTIMGGTDGDLIEGAGGDDILDGEDGYDTLDGGAGTDVCRGGENETDCESS